MDRVNSVEELLQRAAERGMPLEKMRFFIGENRQEPRCFGIYHDEEADRWIVYKNKADGSRAVRYAGPDEAYAAQEIWEKINSEIELRRARLGSRKKKKSLLGSVRNVLSVVVVCALLAFAAWDVYQTIKAPNRGYYQVADDIFYYQNDYWYYFDDYADDWTIYDAPEGDDWYQGAYYGETYPFEDSRDDFSNSGYYEEPRDDSSSASDSDVFDSWDSFDTNWSSDW